jgi:hypothetical protein
LSKNSIEFAYIPSKENAADGLTKPLDPQPFEAFKDLMQLDLAGD